MQQNCTPLVHFSCICNFWCVVIVVDRFLFVSICSWYKKILQLHVCCVVLCSVFVLHVCFVWVCLCAYIKQRILHLIITKIFSYQKGECCPSRHVCVVIDLIVVCVCVCCGSKHLHFSMTWQWSSSSTLFSRQQHYTCLLSTMDFTFCLPM